jgi:GTP-binding protein Era|tara:strand:- start:611 stop:1519 length:909 start_codon:yes stop_codon:yes gene_type:complete
MTANDYPKKCGYVAIVGRPNVGKSTLLNHILGSKLSITSRKPQTTRHNLLGIKTTEDAQIIFIDTPGMHFNQKKALNRYMNQEAEGAIKDVDLIILVLDRDIWNETDERVANEAFKTKIPVIITINKFDKISADNDIAPHIKNLAANFPTSKIIPISALLGHQLDLLESEIKNNIPCREYYFPNDQITDKSERFLVAELIREKIVRQLGAELPYETTVEIEKFKYEKNICHINALILVEREGQKKITIGDKGERLKMIGRESRLDMEKLLENKVMLTLWVKVKRGWSDDKNALKSLGYKSEY